MSTLFVNEGSNFMKERFMKNRKLIINYYFFALIMIAIFAFWYYYYNSVNLSLIIFLSTYFLLFPVVLLFTRRYAFQAFMFILAFITGVYSFYHYSVADHSFLNALYFTFQLFLLMTENVFTETGEALVRYPIVVEIARWSAASYTISTVFVAMYRIVQESVRLTYYQIVGGQYVVVGYNENSKLLIENLSRAGHRIILITEEIPVEQKIYFESNDIVVLVNRLSDQQIYKKAGLEKAAYIILIEKTDAINLDELIAMKEYLSKRVGRHQVEMLIHLMHHESARFVDSFEKDFESKGEALPFSLRVLNIYELLAERLLNNHPLYHGYEKQIQQKNTQPFRVLVVGFGNMGQHITLEILKRAHYFSNKKIEFTFLDRDIKRIKRKWYRDYPESDKVGQFKFTVFNSDEESLMQYLYKHERYSHIYLCLHDDYIDVTEGIELSNAYQDTPIFMKYKKSGSIGQWLDTMTNKTHKIYSTGTFDDVLDEDFFVSQKLMEMGERVYAHYHLEEGISKKRLADLSQFEKEAYLAELNHIPTKLAMLGLKMVPKKETTRAGISKQRYLALVTLRLEELAEVEHNRWCSFYYLKGWHVLTGEGHHVLDESRRLHRALVPYEELLNIPHSFGIDEKRRAETSVVSIYDVTVILEQKIVRIS